MSTPDADLRLLDPKEAEAHPIPIRPITSKDLDPWLASREPRLARWVATQGFNAKPGSICAVPGDEGLSEVLVGLPEGEVSLWDWAALPESLPKGTFRIAADLMEDAAGKAALGWALGAYQFKGYKEPAEATSFLVWPDSADRERVSDLALAIFLARDLVNLPTNHMGPADLARAGKDLAEAYGARYAEIVGRDLLEKNWPAVHAVGRASAESGDRAPRVVELTWGPEDAPKVSLVGKGVCFDTGGLNLKGAANMKLMKKDMGGAASTLGLARLIMSRNLPIRLKVIIPAVENSVSGDAFRPMDVIETRKGLTVEIFNTDAEGRVILADALFEASSENPDLLIDMATLTGAARVALGTECPVIFSTQDDVADGLAEASRTVADPLWRLPLFEDYRHQTESKIADLNNAPDSAFGGAITAALFLQAFVENGVPWVHMDMMGWNVRGRAGRPPGGEAGAIRALFAYLEKRYC